MDEIRIYTVEEVQAILRVTQRTIYNYIKTGKLNAVKIGKYWRVPEATLQEFINKGTNAKEE